MNLEKAFGASAKAERELGYAARPAQEAVRDAVAREPRIAAYLKSSRRIAFNTTGIFRHYRELDRASPF